MSVISNRHTLTPFAAGTSKPLSGQRLARIGYKTTAKTPAKYASVCVSVPPISAEILTPEVVTKLTPHILAMVQDAQDGVIRSLYESADGTLTAVSDEDIGPNACVAYLAAVAAGSRLTAEMVSAWFDANVQENLTVVIATKLGFEDLNDEQLKTINKHIHTYKELMRLLAGGKTKLTPTQISGVRRALEVSAVDDAVSVQLLAKCDAAELPAKEMEMIL